MKGWIKTIDDWIYQNRALSLALTVVLTLSVLALLNWLTGSELFRQFFFPKENDPVEWKELLQAALLLLGLPVAFLLWHLRDINARDQIAEQRNQVENARQDTNLKEFQEVQLRAAGALDEKLPPEAREQLQIAALHQLRIFLQPDQPESFRRAAFELLLAGHAAAIYRIGVPEVQAQIESATEPFTAVQINIALDTLRAKLSPVDRERIKIFRNEFELIFRQDYPLRGRRFDLLDLSNMVFTEKVDLRSSHFCGLNLSRVILYGAQMRWAHFEAAILFSANLNGAELTYAHLSGASLIKATLEAADLWWAHLEGVDLAEAHLEGASMGGADLEGAKLSRAYLKGADLAYASLRGATLRSASLEGANLGGAQLESADLEGAQLKDADLCDAITDEKSYFRRARFNGATQFGDSQTPPGWHSLTEAEREEARAPWVARGMINVDAPLPQPADG